jgi:hypothetical protein
MCEANVTSNQNKDRDDVIIQSNKRRKIKNTITICLSSSVLINLLWERESSSSFPYDQIETLQKKFPNKGLQELILILP